MNFFRVLMLGYFVEPRQNLNPNLSNCTQAKPQTYPIKGIYSNGLCSKNINLTFTQPIEQNINQWNFLESLSWGVMQNLRRTLILVILLRLLESNKIFNTILSRRCLALAFVVEHKFKLNPTCWLEPQPRNLCLRFSQNLRKILILLRVLLPMSTRLISLICVLE